MSENNLQQILVLVEECNIQYGVFLQECQRRGVDFMGLDEYRVFRRGVVEGEHLNRILRVLQRRGFIKIDNRNIFPLIHNFVNPGRHLNNDDIEFGRQLLNQFGDVNNI
jgi:hypothetical protein